MDSRDMHKKTRNGSVYDRTVNQVDAIEMLSHLLDSVSLSSDVIMSYIVDDTYVVNLSTTTTERHYIDNM